MLLLCNFYCFTLLSMLMFVLVRKNYLGGEWYCHFYSADVLYLADFLSHSLCSRVFSLLITDAVAATLNGMAWLAHKNLVECQIVCKLLA